MPRFRCDYTQNKFKNQFFGDFVTPASLFKHEYNI